MYTEITNLKDKTTGSIYIITTKSKIYFITKIVHRLTVRKIKKCLNIINKWGNASIGKVEE